MADSTTAQRTVPRPEGTADRFTGQLVDVETGKVLVYTSWRETPEDQRALRAWLMRWRTARGGRPGRSVRYERFEEARP